MALHSLKDALVGFLVILMKQKHHKDANFIAIVGIDYIQSYKHRKQVLGGGGLKIMKKG